MAPLLYLVLSLLALVAAEIVTLRPTQQAPHALVERQHPHPRPQQPQYHHVPPTQLPDGDADLLEDLELLDIVLLASVDGKFHALNRTSGHSLWSMAPYSTPSTATPAALSPLVRTSHIDYDPEITDENVHQEVYIIEPQSGDIYVMANPSSPLQRFPFSMQELVDMSPFSFPGGEDRRMFVGKKETSLLVVELETGKIKATFNSECPWDQFEDFKDDYTELDLDELDGSKPQKAPPTEVYIGRTDYHVSIFIRPNQQGPPSVRPQVQNLSFSVYGPNKQDNHMQSIYRHTKDNVYIQSSSNGEIISFKAKSSMNSVQTPNSHLLWGQTFREPVVAVFDVLRRKSDGLFGPHPFVLLQPRPAIQDLIPNLSASVRKNTLKAYVGLVEETGSLFAMSPGRYPLVAFGHSEKKSRGRLIDAGKDDDGPTSVDDITEIRKRRESNKSQQELECHERIMNDRRCLVGERILEESDGHETRIRRLIDGPPEPVAGTPYVSAGTDVVKNNESEATGSTPRTTDAPLDIQPHKSTSGSRLWEAFGITLVLGMISFWFFAKRSSAPGSEASMIADPAVSAGKSETLPVANTALPTTLEPPLIPLNAPPVGLEPEKETPPSPVPSTPQHAPPMKDSGDETDKEAELESGEIEATPSKKRTRRGKRGAKKPKNLAVNGDEANSGASGGSGSGNKDNEKVNGKIDGGKGKEIEIEASEPQTPVPQPSLIVASTPKPNATGPSLVVSDTVLGYGSHGTVVFQGSLQGRAVAVKRLLIDFVTLASREVSILQESDDHPNVIRYYYQEAHAGFLYIALELCPASLADLVETPDRDQWRDIAVSFDPKKALRQVTNGLKHLHALKLVHRDIKPQNILVSNAKSGSGGKGNYRMLISDFGLCKKLDVDQTSFLPTAHGAMAAGTVGWRAPEILRGEVKLDDLSDDQSMSSRGSVATINGNASTSSNGSATEKRGMRLTKSVDIFALGCLYYYTLTSGGHPFGDRYEREVNIMKNAKNLAMLERFGEEGTEAANLITKMLDPSPPERPDTTSCLLHPFFWDPGRRLNFLQDASDRFEIMCRDPKDPHLLHLEKDAFSIVGNAWHSRLDKIFIENLGKFRKYDGKSVQDLLRALRNKKHHYQDLPDNVKRHLGPMPEGFLAYFTRRYPNLFLHVHNVIHETGLKNESMFRTYFELPDS